MICCGAVEAAQQAACTVAAGAAPGAQPARDQQLFLRPLQPDAAVRGQGGTPASKGAARASMQLWRQSCMELVTSPTTLRAQSLMNDNPYRSIKLMCGRKLVTMRAHAFVCTVIHGPGPAGWVVRHLCNNPRCINPLHLAWGTAQENKADGKSCAPNS